MTILDGPAQARRIPADGSERPNEHIKRYLDDYLTFAHSPGAAVLLTGAWGSGKTFLMRELIAEHALRGSAILSVSLYGLTGRREIIDALLLARYPALSDMGLRGSRGSTSPDRDNAAPVAPPEAAAYVFDDLERCSMHIAEAMGFINLLVERDGRKVVILANEPRLAERDDGEAYALAKEKMVGRSFTVRPDFGSAFDSFVALVDFQPAADLLGAMRAGVATLFRQSDVQNLRILQQTMWDFERLYRELRPDHHENGEAMGALLRLLFALSFELRADRLKADDLFDRFSKAHAGIFGENAQPSRLRSAATRYPGVALHDTILPDQALHEILVDGLVDGEAVRAALDESSWFRSDEEPSWRTLWHSFERPDQDTEAAATKLVEQFCDRAFAVPGEMLHVFSQMLKLSEWGVTGWSTQETLAECRRYIDDLRAHGRLEPPAGPAADETRFGSYAGLGFDRRDKPDFDNLWAYMREQRRLAELDRHPKAAEDLLSVLTSDPAEFAALIGPREGTNGRYADVPVLAMSDPGAVADALVDLPPLQFNEVLQALSGRYGLGAFKRSLGQELPWAERLSDALLGRAENMHVFGRERIRQMVGWTLTQRLSEARQEAAASDPKVD